MINSTPLYEYAALKAKRCISKNAATINSFIKEVISAPNKQIALFTVVKTITKESVGIPEKIQDFAWSECPT